MKINKKNGFTLAEVMITVILLGTITAIAIPTIVASRPSTEKVLLKKAYNTTEQIITELINNERYYPNIPLDEINTAFSTDESKNTAPSGFFNYKYPPNDENLQYTITGDYDSIDQNSATTTNCNCYSQAHNKLSMLFCCSLKTVHQKNVTHCTTTSSNTNCKFTTQDGIDWETVDVSETSTSLSAPVFIITVDVDNRWGGNHKKITTLNSPKKTVFTFEVFYNGKIKPDENARVILSNALSNNRKVN